MLKQCMPVIETVLDAGGTAPQDFTLHDAGHSFRVAERMAEIIPADLLTSLSVYELALLLLAAYLHDIGMTPEQRKVRDHYNLLLSGEKGSLREDETAELQGWLDDQNLEATIPLSRTAPTREVLTLANELVTHYCRHRHNDWSADWIRKELVGLKLGTYSGWIDDLVLLCKSHHMGYHELRAQRFDPRYVGSPSRMVHLRFLACVLRVADVLDIDPERTPDVIMRHRDVASGSVIYWWKDYEISVIQQGSRFLISARPPDAQVHRAVEVTADQIDEELRLCLRLADETHFEKYPGPVTSDLPHRWPLLAETHRDIAAKDEIYEYVDGAFRPNTRKLLDLLSGPKLYRSPLVAVRELVQNGFDAVREQIAYERLRQPNPSDPEHEVALGKQNIVELRLESAADGLWLVCKDTGVGMSKSVIRDHVLVSGTPKRHEVLDLERRCTEAGFALGRTGQFGIGVLSYFMLADRIIILTRRSQDCPDAEDHGWRFETQGIGSFGELRKLRDWTLGTEVRLHVRTGVLEEACPEREQDLVRYLRRELVRLPCRFKFSPDTLGGEGLQLAPGWVKTAEEFAVRLFADFPEVEKTTQPLETLTAARRKERESTERYLSEVESAARQSVRWKVCEGALPSRLGAYRFHLPYFLLPGGASLAFMRVTERDHQLHVESISEKDLFRLDEHRVAWEFGWNGISVRLDDMRWPSLKHLSTGFVEIDFAAAEAGTIHVDRAGVHASQESLRALTLVDQRIGEICGEFIDKHLDSAYAALNCQIAGVERPPKAPLCWLTSKSALGEGKRTWRRLTTPLMCESAVIPLRELVDTFSVKFRGHEVCLAEALNLESYTKLQWYSLGSTVDKIVVCPTYSPKLVPLWDKLKSSSAHELKSCQFPPRWRNLCGVQFVDRDYLGAPTSMWNRAHPLCRATDSSALKWCANTFKSSLDPLPHKMSLLGDQGRCAGWVITCLSKAAADLWDGIKERDPSFLPELWSQLFRQGSRPIARPRFVLLHWFQGTNPRLRVLSPEGWRVLKADKSQDRPEIESFLPDPGPDWRLELDIKWKDASMGRWRRVLSPGMGLKAHWWYP
jgi:hypothetical protein